MALQIAVLLSIALLAACVGVPHHNADNLSVVENSRGSLWILVGDEVGLPPTTASKQQLFAAWTTAARAKCKGSFTGTPFIQVTSFAKPGQPFAEPYSSGTSTRLTAALGFARCPDTFASIEN